MCLLHNCYFELLGLKLRPSIQLLSGDGMNHERNKREDNRCQKNGALVHGAV